ncbi:hypothetical protein D3C78_1550970 [compost metagenome]
MRGSPLACSIISSMVNAVLSAIPASSMRCGEKPPRPAAIMIMKSVAAAPRLPAGISQPKASPGTKNSINTTPNAAPELIPSTSGLAIGLPVKR